MVKLINLIRSENLKLYSRKSTWVMLILIPVMVCIFSTVGKVRNPLQESIWGLVGDQIMWVFLIDIFTMIVAGNIVANEFNWGTIKLLLIRPVKREKVLLGKYAAVLLFGGLLMAILFGTALLVNLVLYGFHSGGNLLVPGALPAKGMLFNSLGGVLLLYGLKLVEVVVYGTFALMLSVVSKSNALTIGVSIVTMIFGPQLSYIFGRSQWVRYLFVTNLDLVRFFGNGPGGGVGRGLVFSAGVLIGSWMIFNIISWTVFMKRDVLN